MTDRRGAKKLFKTHKGWMAAGVAAATLFSVSVFGGNTVSVEAAGPEPVTAPVFCVGDGSAGVSCCSAKTYSRY